MEPEKVIAAVRQFNLDGITRTRGDLFFTTRRVLFVKTAGGLDLTEALLGILGSAMAGNRSRSVSDRLARLSVEELLASPYEKTEYRYPELEKIAIRPRRIRRSLIILSPRRGRRRKYWGKKKDIVELLSSAPMLRRHGAPLF